MDADEYNELVVKLIKLLDKSDGCVRLKAPRFKISTVFEAVESILAISMVREEIGLWDVTLVDNLIQFSKIQDAKQLRDLKHGKHRIYKR